MPTVNRVLIQQSGLDNMAIYSKDWPHDPQLAKRLGYRYPRSILLPPYLLNNDFFVDYTDAIDEVLGAKVDDKTEILQNIRNMWVVDPELEQKINDGAMLNPEDWPTGEQDLVMRQLNFLGVQLGAPTILFDSIAYAQMCRFLGMYWMEKGKGSFIEFINFCTGSQYVIKNLWTKDYENFYPEGDEAIGTPIWEGGEWYPTTHVQLININGSASQTLTLISKLFHEIANYNLVLYGIDSLFVLPIGGDDGKMWIGVGMAYHEDFVLRPCRTLYIGGTIRNKYAGVQVGTIRRDQYTFGQIKSASP